MVTLTLGWLAAGRNDRQTQCLACRQNGAACRGAFIANHDRFLLHSDALNSTKEFRDAVLALMDEWTDLVEWLSYRHMVTYWLGLLRWRQHTYPSHDLHPPFRGAIPRARVHRLMQTVSARVRLVRATDDGFYALQCAAFRQVQRERRGAYVTRLRQLAGRYEDLVGELRVKITREECVQQMGFFEVKREFDRELEVAQRHFEGDARFEL
ncbi:hypothetical protein EDB80DRAFT_322376 [Ilyonectria destructans]|nr:hypothetical protein EDB80DRAFT_322376 [Ilyonectria destructans]